MLIIGYINEGGKLNLPRLEKFMVKLGLVDRDLFRDHYSDLKMMEQKYVSAVRAEFLGKFIVAE